MNLIWAPSLPCQFGSSSCRDKTGGHDFKFTLSLEGAHRDSRKAHAARLPRAGFKQLRCELSALDFLEWRFDPCDAPS
jgi:hypothetical protein